MNKKEIVNALIDLYSDGKKSRFADMVGVTPQTVSTWIARNTFDIDRIYAKCEDINADWLLSGVGSIKKNKQIENKGPSPPIEIDQKISRYLPLIPIDAIAGFCNGDHNGIRCTDCDLYNIPEFSNAGVEFLIRINGSSMYPLYNSGDILGCKRLSSKASIQWGLVYVIDSAQGSFVKRIYQYDDDNQIQCVSIDADTYPPFLINKADIRSINVVLGVIRLM